LKTPRVNNELPRIELLRGAFFDSLLDFTR
jgi:hypothetical protein